MTAEFQIAIIGSGPGGLSAAARAAELGVSHVLLEAEPRLANTIYKYQKGKHVMAEPGVLPLRSPLPFEAGTREAILDAWDEGSTQHKRQRQVTAPRSSAIEGADGALRDRAARTARRVEADARRARASACRATCASSACPATTCRCVQYQLDDPDEYEDETIVVVGAGDAAIENAIALAEAEPASSSSTATTSSRAARRATSTLILEAIEDGRIECRYGAAPRARRAPTGGRKPRALTLVQTPDGPDAIACDRIIARLGATAAAQVRRELAASSSRTRTRPSVPAISPTRTSRTCRASTSSARSAATR